MKQFVASLALTLFVSVVYARDLSGCTVRCNTYLHEPVCAYNGKEYRMFQNTCLMLTKNCGSETIWIQHPMSDCQQDQDKRAKECPNMCPMNYAPICASDGRTNRVFSNQCDLDSANCRSEKRWITTRSSDCNMESMFGTVEVSSTKQNDNPSNKKNI